MPNPARLYQLTQLREQAHLTLADMAQRCGLTGKQARKTVSDWEAGHATPRASRRLGVMRYLWHDLNLQADPARFNAIWQLLVEEWEWTPLSAAERAELLAPPEESSAPVLVDNGVASVPVGNAPAEAPPSPVFDDAGAASPLAALPLPLPAATGWWQRWGQRRRWLLLVVTMVLFVVSLGGTLRLLLTPTTPAVVVGDFKVTVQTPAATPRLIVAERTTVPALVNGSFEASPTFAGWGLYEECDYRVVIDPELAQSGDHYLAIHNRRPSCYSFYQDLFTLLPVGDTYRAAIWLRSPTGAARRGRLTLWALGANPQSQDRNFAVSNMNWTCLETTLLVQRPGNTQLKLELYLDSHDGIDYHFDSAVLGQGKEHLCPTAQLTIADLKLVQPSGRIYPAATVGVEVVVKNVGPTDVVTPTSLRYWTATQADGSPLDPSTNRSVPVPALAAGESVIMPHLDLYLPINLPTDQAHFIVVDLATTGAPDNFQRGLARTSLPFQAIPCSQGTLYCDVPAGHWAAPEIQAWYDAGISQSCRSNTEPFVNRPFCPDALVLRWMMAAFLLRRLEGKDYQPTAPYQGIYEDVPEELNSHNGARVIETLTTSRVDLRSEACPPRGEHLRFCPNDPLRRVDFVLALLALQRWDLHDVAGKHFVDMAPGSQAARAAEYMWQQGFLPENDPDCPGTTSEPRFCPNDPLRRASAAVMMSRALELNPPRQ